MSSSVAASPSPPSPIDTADRGGSRPDGRDVVSTTSGWSSMVATASARHRSMSDEETWTSSTTSTVDCWPARAESSVEHPATRSPCSGTGAAEAVATPRQWRSHCRSLGSRSRPSSSAWSTTAASGLTAALPDPPHWATSHRRIRCVDAARRNAQLPTPASPTTATWSGRAPQSADVTSSSRRPSSSLRPTNPGTERTVRSADASTTTSPAAARSSRARASSTTVPTMGGS